ncbi:GGDEF domain-containing protein [Moorellaceae bacterium AZ2]
MPTVEGLLSQTLYTIEPWASVRRAATFMEYHGIGCLPVIDDEGKLVGIITSRDIKSSHPNRLVADAMSREVITINPSTSLWEAHHLMATYKLERLVVVDDQRIIGIITSAQVMSELGKYVDVLTGLHKAEILYERAVQLLAEGHEISIIFLDLDNFGRLNKQYGHVYGDHILCQTAQVLKGLMKDSRDTLCRYGGDEFAVLTVQSLNGAERLVQEIIKAVQEEKWPFNIKVTFSAGIAGGRWEGSRDSNQDPKYTAKNLVNLASLASTKAKKLKVPVIVADALEFKKKPLTAGRYSLVRGKKDERRY